MSATTTRYDFSVSPPAGHSTTMTQVANSQPRNVEALVEKLDYMDTPIARLIKKDGKTGDNVKQEWTDEVHPPVADQLNGAIDGSTTTVNVDNGARFQVYNLIKIDNEVLWVTGIATNALTVATRGSMGTSAASHLDDAKVLIMGTATPEKVDAVASVVSRGASYFNYFQILQKAIEVSDRQNNAGSYLIRGKEFPYEQARKYKEMWRDLEIVALNGVPFAGSASLPSTMGGIPSFITKHVTDLSNQAFDQVTLMALIQDIWFDVGPENVAKLIVAGAVPRRAISSFYKNETNIQMRPQDRKVDLVVKTISTELGNFDLMDPSFHINQGLVLLIDPDNYRWRNFAGYGELHETKLPAGGAYQKGAFTCDKTIIAMGDRASGKLINASTTTSDYDGLS